MFYHYPKVIHDVPVSREIFQQSLCLNISKRCQKIPRPPRKLSFCHIHQNPECTTSIQGQILFYAIVFRISFKFDVKFGGVRFTLASPSRLVVAPGPEFRFLHTSSSSSSLRDLLSVFPPPLNNICKRSFLVALPLRSSRRLLAPIARAFDCRDVPSNVQQSSSGSYPRIVSSPLYTSSRISSSALR